MEDELETWLIDTADQIIRRSEDEGAKLSELDQAIYDMWIVSYAVRKSGTLEPMYELHPAALQNLKMYARSHGLSALSAWLATSKDVSAFCSNYYTGFEVACQELRQMHERESAPARPVSSPVASA